MQLLFAGQSTRCQSVWHISPSRAERQTVILKGQRGCSSLRRGGLSYPRSGDQNRWETDTSWTGQLQSPWGMAGADEVVFPLPGGSRSWESLQRGGIHRARHPRADRHLHIWAEAVAVEHPVTSYSGFALSLVRRGRIEVGSHVGAVAEKNAIVADFGRGANDLAP